MAELEPAYDEREKLDSELNAAIADILSAEQRAHAIIEQAAETVKAVQLDGATRERDMRTAAINDAARRKSDAVKAAAERGLAQAESIKQRAAKDGEELLKSKAPTVEKIATELFRSL